MEIGAARGRVCVAVSASVLALVLATMPVSFDPRGGIVGFDSASAMDRLDAGKTDVLQAEDLARGPRDGRLPGLNAPPRPGSAGSGQLRDPMTLELREPASRNGTGPRHNPDFGTGGAGGGTAARRG